MFFSYIIINIFINEILMKYVCDIVVFAGENDVEVAESLSAWIQNKQRTKQQNNRESTGDIWRYIIENKILL